MTGGEARTQSGSGTLEGTVGVRAARRRALKGMLLCGLVLLLDRPGRLLARREDENRSFDPAWHGSEWQVLEIATDDTLIVPAEVAGRRVRAILDSGSAASIVSTALAATLGLHGSETRKIRGMSGRAAVTIARNIPLKFGRREQRLSFVVVASLDTVSAALGRSVELVLGNDVLAGLALFLDIGHRRLASAPSRAFQGGSGWTALPLRLGTNREQLIMASISGRPPAPLILDLGSANALVLSARYAAENGLLDGRRRSTAALAGVEGIHIATAFSLDRIDLAGSSVTGIPALADEAWLSASAIGAVGLPLLGQFDIVLDLNEGHAWLRPLPTERRLPMVKDRSGFGLAASASALTVMHIAPGSPAADAGWAVGERIVAIDGRRVDRHYTTGRLWRWRFAPTGTLVTLETDRGATRELRLRDYY